MSSFMAPRSDTDQIPRYAIPVVCSVRVPTYLERWRWWLEGQNGVRDVARASGEEFDRF
jgi:hypothetical protein